MRIQVTGEDIADGERGSIANGTRCPVARALARHGLVLALCRFTEASKMEVFRFMADFDLGRGVQSFEFEVE